MPAVFLKSSADNTQLPPPKLPEYAFIGRSNVGKSSLINMLVNQKGLAKTSATPGKTQLINHFVVDNAWYLVDLPGYGFAKVPKPIRAAFEGLINGYLLHRPNLMNTFLLVDSRHEPQPKDLEMIQRLGGAGLPFSIVFTKVDKLSARQLRESAERYQGVLAETWETLPPFFFTSADKQTGREEVLAYIQEINGLFDPKKVSTAS